MADFADIAGNDKRSVHTDALETLGFKIGPNEHRDAIHLAVEPVVAAHDLQPGQHVGFVVGGVGVSDKPLGIVDPFIEGTVKKGERFWLLVYPRQITSLRHVWAHPAFSQIEEGKAAPSDSEMFIRNVARSIGVGYEELMDHARDYIHTGDSWCEGGRFEGESLPEDFWGHFETVTGLKESGKGWSFFSCSC